MEEEKSGGGTMSEIMPILLHEHSYDLPDLFSEKDLLQSLSPEQLEDFIQSCGHKLRETTRLLGMALEIKTGISATSCLEGE